MSNKGGPLITSAGRNHVILSKQFCIVLSVVLVCAAFLFYRVEQTAVRRSLMSTQHIKEQNELLEKKNTELYQIKKQLETDEEELTKMYEKWLTDDGEDLALTKSSIKAIKAELEKVQASQEAHNIALNQKEETLSGKEDILSDLHAQLRQKNVIIKRMKQQIRALNGTLPTIMSDMPDDDDWAW
eukprot:m.321517 g.321517  ORF g.321517 m.321517 type:complete len:185 (+) comp25449_c0_seq1:79-633(+)